MEKDKWINDILESTKGMHRAEPSPFIFEQITAKINNKARPVYSSDANVFVRWSLAVLVSVIISVNLISIVKSNVKDQNAAENTVTETVLNLNNATIYSY
jgi:hypothetical protein